MGLFRSRLWTFKRYKAQEYTSRMASLAWHALFELADVKFALGLIDVSLKLGLLQAQL
jgi:hypothetical protein